uniref:Major facilitator superfamily (MFS) profile domain-containing protein n=1 Tax=Glycine max TaxID=3847 RepID=A0A0R0FPT7_SOYBN
MVGSQFNWRVAFWVEEILMLPFPILGFVIKPLQLKGDHFLLFDVFQNSFNFFNPCFAPSKSKQTLTYIETNVSETGGISESFELLHDQVYAINVVGYIAYNFVIGAYSFWGLKAGYNIYHMNNVDLLFGGITIVCGIVGTLAGGLFLDRISSTVSNAFKLLSGATFLGAIFCFISFLFKSLSGFIVFSMGELLIFVTQITLTYLIQRSFIVYVIYAYGGKMGKEAYFLHRKPNLKNELIITFSLK